MTPQLSTKYVFTITAAIGSVTSAGDVGHGVRRIIPITGGEVRGDINGIRFGPVELLQRLKRGEPVDPGLIYCRTVPKFETGSEKYRWLMQNLFIGSAARHADRVVIDVHQVL